MQRVPPSGSPKAPPQVVRTRRPVQTKHIEKPVKLKTGAEESEASSEVGKSNEGAGATHDPHEHAKLSEAWQPDTHAEQAEKKEAKEELHEEEKAEGGTAGADKNPRGFLKQIKPALHAPQGPPVGQQGQKKAKDGFEGQQGPAQPLKTASTQQTGTARALVPVKATSAAQAASAAPPAPRPSRPPDAFSVLHAAQEPGVFFKEEGHNGAAEQSDPELSAAIEEAIRLLFGVRGILRVSGGFNQEDQPAIIVVATQGFGEASMKLIPPKVHRFETILAVPYDMLPLKRERL